MTQIKTAETNTERNSIAAYVLLHTGQWHLRGFPFGFKLQVEGGFETSAETAQGSAHQAQSEKEGLSYLKHFSVCSLSMLLYQHYSPNNTNTSFVLTLKTKASVVFDFGISIVLV